PRPEPRRSRGPRARVVARAALVRDSAPRRAHDGMVRVRVARVPARPGPRGDADGRRHRHRGGARPRLPRRLPARAARLPREGPAAPALLPTAPGSTDDLRHPAGADARRRALLRGLRRRDAPHLLGGRDGRDLHGRGPGRPRAGAPFRAPDADGLPPGPSGLTRADGRDSADRLNGNPPSRLRRLEILLAQTYRMHMPSPLAAGISFAWARVRREAGQDILDLPVF